MAISRSDMERQLRNMGGIMSLQEPRQGYFLGKIVKKAKRAVKKVVKSPIGKAAILAGLSFGIPGTGFSGLAGKGGLGSFFGKGSLNPFMAKGKFSGLGSLLNKVGLVSGTGGLTGLGKLASIGAVSGLGGLMAAKGQQEDEDEEDFYRGEGLNIADIIRRARMNDPEFRFLPGAQFTGSYAEGGEVNLEKDPEYKGWKKMYMMNPDAAESHPKHTEFENYLKSKENKKAEGGIMNLGGMEMDLRGGGFVPLGAKEKADDVPARLSKNEFVMTADAVRAAGGGSVDKGADKMYNLMKDLEAQV